MGWFSIAMAAGGLLGNLFGGGGNQNQALEDEQMKIYKEEEAQYKQQKQEEINKAAEIRSEEFSMFKGSTF